MKRPSSPPDRRRFFLALPVLLVLLVPGCRGGGTPAPEAGAWIRVNQAGYLPDASKVAVRCALSPGDTAVTFAVLTAEGEPVLEAAPTERGEPLAGCRAVERLDFSRVRREGTYRIVAGGVRSPPVRVHRAVYRGLADSLLAYLRQQRSGYNPVFDDSVHAGTDGILVDHPTRAGEFIDVAGGWADAADYLQYGATSAHATYMLLMAYRDHPGAWGDGYRRDGRPGENGIPDVLDEARWGLEWLLRMYPEDDLLLNQIGDDRDHAFWDLPPDDSSDYGWGRGSYRPVYPCTGRPQGLFEAKNRSTGLASTAGKYAAAYALGARLFREIDAAFADSLAGRARAAYLLGRNHPGVCQTAPGRSPYFYEEGNWVDDMELAAAELHALDGGEARLSEALAYARREPVTPWMGRDTARHYEFFPWHNNGHYAAWRSAPAEARERLAGYYREGIRRVVGRAGNGFRIGVPFIWCSNDLVASFATQAHLYRRMTGDASFRSYEEAAVDWLLGVNPWGVSMLIDLPPGGRSPRDPHSVVAAELGVGLLTGGLVDGPVYRSIFGNLLGIRLHEPDEFAPLNDGSVVYHDDLGDYATNEPILDGTANLSWILAARSGGAG